MAKRRVIVTQEVVVEYNPSAFTEEFMEEFRRYHYPFMDIDDHLQHLAQLYARGLIEDFGDRFIEGYGKAAEFGLSFNVTDADEEVVKDDITPSDLVGE